MSKACLVLRVDTTTKPPMVVAAGIYSSPSDVLCLRHGPAFRYVDVFEESAPTYEEAEAKLLERLNTKNFGDDYYGWLRALLTTAAASR